MKHFFYSLTLCVMQLQRLALDADHSFAVTAVPLVGQDQTTFSEHAFANYYAMISPEERLQVVHCREQERKSVLGGLILANYPDKLSNAQLEAIVSIELRFPLARGYVMSRSVPFMSDEQVDLLLAQDSLQMPQEDGTNREMSRLLDQSNDYIRGYYKRLSTYVAIMLSRDYDVFEASAEHVALAAMLMQNFPNAWSEAGLAYLSKSPYYVSEEHQEVTQRAETSQ